MKEIWKIKLVAIGFLFVFILILGRLFYWQVIKGEKLAAQAEDQHYYTLIVPAKRGEIRFHDSSPLVSNKNSFLLYSNLSKLTNDKELVSEKLAEILSMQIPLISTASAQISQEEKDKFLKSNQQDLKKKLFERLNYKDGLWVNLAHFVSRSNKDLIKSLNITGLEFTPEETRDYPEASIAAHILGFVGSDRNGSPKGYFGLEGYYERELSGKPGELRVEKDAFGRPIAIGEEERREKQNGNQLVTNLDRSVQLFVERNLEKGISDWKAIGGSAVVANPKTGAIIAMANFPSYHPENFSYFSTSLYKNPAVADLYEPGSIMKPLIMAAAINENTLTPETRCDRCDGPRLVGGFFIHTFNNTYHPNLTMTETLINSDNTGMVFAGEKLGFNSLYEYLKKFGFGQKTGIDLEEEEGGSLRDPDTYYESDRATLSFGQGVAVNAVQMVKAFSALANGGKPVTPHLVSDVWDGQKKIKLNWKTGPQVISESTAKTVTEMMVQVCEESPTRFPRERIRELEKYKIACKSGTAQIAIGGKYKEKGTTASVIGFFPANDPKFLIYVKLVEPELRPWGSDTAGPVFFNIIRDLINHYLISP